jgi:hypothetical protein
MSKKKDKKVHATLPVDADDARELRRHARRLGVSVDTLLEAAMTLCVRELSGQPIPAKTVEYLAKRGVSILRKDDLN